MIKCIRNTQIYVSRVNLVKVGFLTFSILLFLSYFSVMATTIKSLSKTKRSFSETFRQNIYTHRQPTLKTRLNDASSSNFLNHSSNINPNSNLTTLKQTNNLISSLKPTKYVEQNPMTLRKQLDKLQKTLLQQRTSNKLLKGYTNRMKEKLKTQFSDQINFDHLGSKQYLLQGIKSQYYRMKEKLQQKNQQYEELLRMRETSFMEEAKIYCQTLQNENNKLRKMLQKMLDKEQNLFEEMQSQLYQQISQSQAKIQGTVQWKKQQEGKIASLLGVSATLISLQKQREDLQQEVRLLQQKSKFQGQSIKQKKDKIIYLKRTMKSSQSEANKKNLQLCRENKRLNESIEQLRTVIVNQEDRYRVWIYVLVEKEKKKYETKLQILMRYLRESQDQVQKLKEQLKKSKKTTGMKVSPLIKNIKQQQGYLKISQQKRKKSLKQEETLGIAKQKREISISFIQQQQQKQVKHQIQAYYPKYSHIKHSKQCLKVRPIIIQQLQQIQQQLNYRLMYYRIPCDQLKKYIDNNVVLVSSNSAQKYRYLRQKDLKDIFQEYPFNLAESNALLVARYVVEDPSKGDVYFHQDNQVDKIVAQSIVKSFIGEYSIPSEQESKLELSGIMKGFRQNIQSALSAYTKDGLISQKKLRRVLQDINIKISHHSWRYLISQLMAFSQFGLQKLNSKLIFALF